MNPNPNTDNLDPGKLSSEDYIRSLLPPELWSYQDGQLLVSKEGLACLAIGVIEGKLEGNKENAQKILDQLDIPNPFKK